MKYYKCFFVVLCSQFMIYLAHHFICTTVFTYQKYLSKNLSYFGMKRRGMFFTFCSFKWALSRCRVLAGSPPIPWCLQQHLSFKTMAPLKQQLFRDQLWTVLDRANHIVLGKTAGRNSAFLAGEEEHKHDLLVQVRGHLAGKEVAWTPLSNSIAVPILYPMPGNITEQGQQQEQQGRFHLSRDFWPPLALLIPHRTWNRVSCQQVLIFCSPDKCFCC